MICPKGYIPLVDFRDFYLELLEERLAEVVYLRDVVFGSIGSSTQRDGLMSLMAEGLQFNLYAAKHGHEVYRVSNHFWYAKFGPQPRLFDETLLSKFRNTYPEISFDFNIGWALSDEILSLYRDNEKFRESLKKPLCYACKGHEVISEHPGEHELEAAMVQHQHEGIAGQLLPQTFWNPETNKIDYSLYNAALEFSKRNGVAWMNRENKIIADALRPLEGASLCVVEDTVTKKGFPSFCDRILEHLFSYFEHDRRKPSKLRTRGRPPAPAKKEYLDRYPEGRPEGLSFEAVAAELSELGYNITARAIQNYEAERKKET